MNQNTNQTGTNFTGISSQQQFSETNPFTADLKGEFSSNFGTNTNAVSQIFKDGGFVQNNNKKWIIAGVAFVLICAAAFFLLRSPATGDSEFDEFASSDEVMKEMPATQPTTEAVEMTEAETVVEEYAAPATEQAVAQQQVQYTGTGNVQLFSVGDGTRLDYDETAGALQFSWSGSGGHIIFARNSNMKPETMRIPVSSNSYEFYNPYPGTWYWRVENSDGVSEVRHFVVNPPARRNVALQQPLAGDVLASNNGVISWTEDSKVAFYRVELTNNGGWANPTYKFATSGGRIATQNLAAGQYQLRVGAFSEVAGRWEYTTPITVTVR